MANPQLEHGFTRVANELLEALARYPFTKRQYAVLLAVIRLSYGYGAKAARVSSARLAELTGIGPEHCRGAVRELEAMGVLRSQTGPEGKTLALVKQFDKWRSGATDGRAKTAQGGGPKQPEEAGQNGPEGGPNRPGLPGQNSSPYKESKETVVVGNELQRQQQTSDSAEILHFPPQLSDAERDQAAGWLAGLNGEAQPLLDVLAANIQAGTVKKSPLSLLRALIKSARAGVFDPSPGLHIAAQRARRQREEAERAATRAARNQPPDPNRIAKKAQWAAEVKKALHQPRSKPE